MILSGFTQLGFDDTALKIKATWGTGKREKSTLMARQIFFEKIGKKASVWYSFFIRNENQSLLEQVSKKIVNVFDNGSKI